jgi:DNA-3-methyladenine glycosylase II
MPSHEAQDARRHLRHVDSRLAAVVQSTGLVNPYVWPGVDLPEGDLLSGLAFHIVGQQISWRVAIVLFEKLKAQLRGEITAERLAASTVPELRSAGLTTAKSRALIDLGLHIINGEFSLERLRDLDDNAAEKQLITLRGVGPWSAQLFLLLELRRPDIFPAGDLGLRIAVGRLDDLPKPPSIKDTAGRAEIWSPFRSYAAAYLWTWRTQADQTNAPKPGHSTGRLTTRTLPASPTD